MSYYRDIDDVVETLKNAQKRDKKCALLIGAGCSVKAGVPLASEFVEIIANEYSRAYNRAKEKTYPHCMAELLVSERRDLIKRYVDNAKLNWAYICIAQLMKSGFIDRIYTTNFDQLVVRACALLGIYPAIFDFATSQLFRPADIDEKAVFYLHGQSSGFVLLNTEAECEKFSGHMEPVFQDAGEGRVWLVAGYSGENDPVFNHLTATSRFDNGLYWIGYKDNEPAQHVREKLLTKNKDAFYVKKFDADSFFIELAQKLDCFPPELISQPFTYLEQLLKPIVPFNPPGETSENDVMHVTREMIKKAITNYEKEPTQEDSNESELIKLYMAGEYQKVLEYAKSRSVDALQDFDAIAWSNIMLGNALLYQAETKSEEEADQLFTQAREKYAEAVRIKPDKHEALYNWGLAFSQQAVTKSGEEADQLVTQAREKFAETVRIKPDDHEAFNSWGIAFSQQAETKNGEEADQLFTQAGEKFAEAVRIKPDYHEAFNNWGVALLKKAKTKRQKDKIKIYSSAKELLLKAEKIKSGCSSYNLACICSLTKKFKDCKNWLKACRKMGLLPEPSHLRDDSDLDAVRKFEWFKEFINN